MGFYSCEPTPFNLSDDPQLYITEFLYAMKGIIMRNLILAFGLILFPAVVMAAPSNTNCKFRVLSSGPAFTKGCDADARTAISKAVKVLKTRYTLREDIESMKDSALSFYEDHCTRPVADYKALAKRMLKDSRRGYKVKNGKRVKVEPLSRKSKKTLRKYARVNAEKATPMTWKMCYNNLPSHKQMQQMMVPNMARRTFVWHKCSPLKNRHDFARCAWKAASNKDGAAEKAITEVIEAYLELRFQKEEAKVIIKKKTGGCELAAFGKLKCAGIDSPWLLVALLLFAIGRQFPQTRVVCGIVGMILGIAICVSDANAEPCVNQAHNLSSASEMLTCDLIFSSTESNRKYTFAALGKAYISVCSVAEDYTACYTMYQEARRLFKERMGAIVLKHATAIADSSYGDGRVSACPLSQNICNSINWKVK